MVNAAQDRGQPEQSRQVEVSVSVADAELVRRVAKALINDDETARCLQEAPQEGVPGKVTLKFKDLLASFPDDDEPP